MDRAKVAPQARLCCAIHVELRRADLRSDGRRLQVRHLERREQQHRPGGLGPRELHAELVGEAEAGGRLALHAANPDVIY